MSMGKRPRKGGDEDDAFSRRWRFFLTCMKRPGYRKQSKKKANRRERRETREGLHGGMTEW